MDKVTILQVRDFIFHCESPETLRTLSAVINDQFKRLSAKLAFTFEVGERVYFIKGKRSPKRLADTVVKMDAKSVYLLVDGYLAGPNGFNWRVSPTLLRREKLLEAPVIVGALLRKGKDGT